MSDSHGAQAKSPRRPTLDEPPFAVPTDERDDIEHESATLLGEAASSSPPPVNPSLSPPPPPPPPPGKSWSPGLICLVVSVAVITTSVLAYVLSALVIGSKLGSNVQHLRTVLSSPYDDRTFSYVEFDNGLQALLVHDPDAMVSAAALDVRVGSWADPPEFPGLAHFLEHMVRREVQDGG